eukprot:6768905-Alexandrium_andersonii.AAC.1
MVPVAKATDKAALLAMPEDWKQQAVDGLDLKREPGYWKLPYQATEYEMLADTLTQAKQAARQLGADLRHNELVQVLRGLPMHSALQQGGRRAAQYTCRRRLYEEE